jgi:hypothetical protein
MQVNATSMSAVGFIKFPTGAGSFFECSEA